MKLETIFGGTAGTNCYLIEDNKNIILIDFVPEVEDIIKENGYSLDKLLLTHIHFDHIERLSYFQEKYNFELVLSENAYKNINNPTFNLLSFINPQMHLYIKDVDLNIAKIVKSGEQITWNDEIIDILESPGHSDDSLIFIFRKLESVFSGDTLFYGSIGRTDFPNSNFDDIQKSIETLFSKVEDKYAVYPGHGSKTSIEFEKKNNPFLRK